MIFGLLRRNETKREIVINAEPLETRVAVLENGVIEEYQVEHPTQERIVGSIFKGRIQNLEHELQAAFVDIGLKKNAFLHYWDMLPDDSLQLEIEEDNQQQQQQRRSRRKRFTNEDIEKQFPAGSEIIVQVTKASIGTKGPRVTANLSIPGRYLVMVPGSSMKGISRKIDDGAERQRLKKILGRLALPEDVGLIVRTAAIGARKRGFVKDLRGLLLSWEELQRAKREDATPCCVHREPDLVERVVRDWLTEDVDRITVDSRKHYERIREVAGRISRRSKGVIHLYEGDRPVFDHFDIERQIGKAFGRTVTLKSGGCIVIDETEALIAVDVNTGRHKGKGGSQEEAILAVNTEAAEEVARQLRLRNIGGLVVIDLIDMKSRKHQHAVLRAMKAALKRDRARTNVLPISDLGLLEMTRQRAEEGIHSSIHVDCPYCGGQGKVTSPLGISVEIQRQLSAVLRRRRSQGRGLERIQVVVHPTVLDRLRSEDEEILIELQEQFAGQLTFKSDPSKHMEYFAIRDLEMDQVLYSSREH